MLFSVANMLRPKFSSDESTKNMKRESRVYSYKEQLEEIQLRKELEEKRRLSGKPVTYSAKQKEAIKTQMAKEKIIRENVAKVYIFFDLLTFYELITLHNFVLIAVAQGCNQGPWIASMCLGRES